MSDLKNLFAQRKKASPSSAKRLFAVQSKDKRYTKMRSNQPNKSIRKNSDKASKKGTTFTPKDFTKRHLQKGDIKKQIAYYNHQILLGFIRKNFFIMGAVILFNILFTSSQKQLILSNMMFSIVFVKFQLGKDLLEDSYFVASKELIKLLVYSLNFYLFSSEINPSLFERNQKQIFLISLNGCINYLILVFYRPFMSVSAMDNKRPYENGFQQLKRALLKIIKSYRQIYYLRKPIILVNLAYWLLVLIYIMYQQSQILLASLVNLQTVFSITLTVFLLHTFAQIIQKIDELMIIQLFSFNQKTLGVTLLRLNRENKNNQKIANQAVKYLSQNCEIIWDIDLLRHNYAINYDVIDDYLNLQLQKINQKLLQSTRILKNLSIERKRVKTMVNEYVLTIKEIGIVQQITSLLEGKQYLFYVVEHIIYFQSYSEKFPINVNTLHRKLSKTKEILVQIQQIITINELKKSINTFCCYLHNNIIIPFQ